MAAAGAPSEATEAISGHGVLIFITGALSFVAAAFVGAVAAAVTAAVATAALWDKTKSF